MNLEEEFINESVIGTKEYWDNVYSNDIENADVTIDDTWFGKRNTNKIIDWINKNIDCNDSICDLGCGNGYVLTKLAYLHFNKLYGIDYSSKAIEYCHLMSSKQEITKRIKYEILDILNLNSNFTETFKVFIDKGTYDALCLMPDSDIQLNRQTYFNFITKHLELNGIFILMSCNFTKEELCRFLLNSKKDMFELIHEFDTPTMAFGGQVGRQVTGLVFKKLQ